MIAEDQESPVVDIHQSWEVSGLRLAASIALIGAIAAWLLWG